MAFRFRFQGPKGIKGWVQWLHIKNVKYPCFTSPNYWPWVQADWMLQRLCFNLELNRNWFQFYLVKIIVSIDVLSLGKGIIFNFFTMSDSLTKLVSSWLRGSKVGILGDVLSIVISLELQTAYHWGGKNTHAFLYFIIRMNILTLSFLYLDM